MSTTMTVRLEDEVKDRLEHLAAATHRSKSFLAAEAIRAYIENNEWQVGEIQAALQEADAGDLRRPSHRALHLASMKPVSSYATKPDRLLAPYIPEVGN